MHGIEEKLMTAGEAVKKFVRDGGLVFIGGFGHLYPYALAHEVIRQRKRNLTLCKHSPEIIGDQMVGAGCVKKLIVSWFGNPGIGSAHAFRRAVEQGIPHPIELEEYTHFALTVMLKAGAMNVPFIPSRAILGSDLVKHAKRIKIMECPFTGQKLCLLPALNPDVALIHAQRADTEGNVQVWGIVGDIREGAFASKSVVVSVEEIVPQEVIRRDPNRTVIPSFKVDAVIEEPWGAHPSYAQGYYDRDNEYYVMYHNETRTLEGFERFLEEWIYGVSNRREYVKKLGAEKLLKLRPKSYPSLPVDYGHYL